MTKDILLLSMLILIVGCDKKEDASTIAIVCPDELYIEIIEPAILSSEIDLPLPAVQTDCSNMELTYTLDIARTLTQGTHTGVFNVTDACGNKGSCAFVLNVNVNPSAITTDCPYIFTLDMGSPEIITTEINLPIQDFIHSTCTLGGLEYFFNPDTLGPGTHFANCYITDGCGNRKTCLVKLTLLYDYRDKFLGTYTGLRKCEHVSNNGITHSPDTLITLTVVKGDHDNTVYIVEDDDEVMVDSTGKLDQPSISGYRFYGLQFRNDSMFMYQNTGGPVSNTTCGFRGKKNN
jgi:hypothetical protein